MVDEGLGHRRLWRRLGLLAGIGVAVAAVLLVVAAIWLQGRVRGSLPVLDGALALQGLQGPVRIQRDALGVPSVRARGVVDLMQALGFLHAQDRFFQMDLLRRSAAGELSELFGPATLGLDRTVRIHRLRAVAHAALERSPPRQRRIVEAYTRGVNQGLAALSAPPFEYLLLRVDPVPWRPADSVLVSLAMFIDLQDENGATESARGVMHETLPGPLFEFLTCAGTEWDAPLTGGALPAAPVPGPEIYDLRHRAGRPAAATVRAIDDPPLPGSNNWAVAGWLTADGRALVANDMHLPLRVPNIWYRAMLSWRQGDAPRRAVGVTLPGTPALVAGSNGNIAWGFTNSYGDWLDVVLVELHPDDAGRYRTPDGFRSIEAFEETLRVRGGPDETLTVRWTIWGPLTEPDPRGRPRALRWTAHSPEAVDLSLFELAAADNVREALDIANRAGAPALNIVVGDRAGSIGWTILGRIPRRVGFDGRLPSSWADGTRGWQGWLAPGEYPRVLDPPAGRLWTANNRVVDGRALAVLGDGGYALGARARQIRDRLRERARFDELDMLEIQLDDRAVLLERWRALLLGVLTPEAQQADPRRAELRHIVEHDWNGRAAVESAGYRMVRAFRSFLSAQVQDVLLAPCRAVDARLQPNLTQWEGALWALVVERPAHLLDPALADWDAQLLSAVDATLEYFSTDETPLARHTWGRRNTVRVEHPLSGAIPLLGRLLNMRVQQLPGGSHMPRFQSPRGGASQRMVVAPGREQDGIFHMPGGQSGHPLSPHYRDAHPAWARGEATPLLPGPAVHLLQLSPSGVRSPLPDARAGAGRSAAG